jgi:hypothetical protein
VEPVSSTNMRPTQGRTLRSKRDKRAPALRAITTKQTSRAMRAM